LKTQLYSVTVAGMTIRILFVLLLLSGLIISD